jgi:hypothetical protein
MSQSLSEAAAARLDAFHALLDDDPQDWLIRSLLADWYADQGDSVAEDCLRWQAREKKRPLSIGQRWTDSAGAGMTWPSTRADTTTWKLMTQNQTCRSRSFAASRS